MTYLAITVALIVLVGFILIGLILDNAIQSNRVFAENERRRVAIQQEHERAADRSAFYWSDYYDDIAYLIYHHQQAPIDDTSTRGDSDPTVYRNGL